MPLLNNALYNAAFIGFIQGALKGRSINSPVSANYAALKNAAVVFATNVDDGIPFDAQITTGGSNTMLVDTGSNVIQSNTQFKPALLQAICESAMSGRYTEDLDSADYNTVANACAAAYTQSLLGLVSP